MVGDEAYVEFQAAHVDRIGKLLVVPWAAEGATALLLLIWAWRQRDQALLPPLVIGGIAMGVVLIVEWLLLCTCSRRSLKWICSGGARPTDDCRSCSNVGMDAASGDWSWVSVVIWKRRTS